MIDDVRRSHQRPFSVSRFETVTVVDGVVVHEPASEVHAKLMGTMVTLCGTSSQSMFKFWDIPFASVVQERCPGCIAALASPREMRKPKFQSRGTGST